MGLIALIVVIFGTLLFIGFAVFMGFYSRREEETGKESEAE
jgi:cell division protein FtsX